VDINTFMRNFYITFPRFFMDKRYKLITFAPKGDNVENLSKYS